MTSPTDPPTTEPANLWHPANTDPFAQFEDEADGGNRVADLYAQHRTQQGGSR